MLQITDSQSEKIIGAGRKLWDLAEPGYMERETHAFLRSLFDDLGFTVDGFGGIPGFRAALPGAVPRIALVADMDALPLPGDADGRYIHSCGHHMQMAVLYGAARLLKDAASPVLPQVAFMAIPAEEYIDFDRREPLRTSGAVTRLSGKLELLERGAFRDFDMVVSTHGAGFTAPRYISSVRRMAGFDVMTFSFSGRAAHGGAAPPVGVNAQNAASLCLQACAFLRESFDEAEHIRIHPILKLPEGQSVNIIPDTATVETYARGATPEAVASTVARLTAAAEGCARAIGASVEIERVPGYAPFRADEEMHEVLRRVVESSGIPFIDEEYGSASSDMGDVSRAVPSVMLGLPGANGLFHNPDFRILDEEAAYVLPSRITAEYLEALADERPPGLC